MIKTSYQTPELRDANDNIVQQGAFGKNTALSNSTNDGWIDYVMNNLEALHSTIGDSAPTLDGNGHVVEPANLAIGDEDGVRLKTGYVKTSGGTINGILNIAQNLKMQDNQENVFGGLYVPGTTATLQYLQLYGGETPSSNGGNLQLPNDGSWTLQAKNGATAYNLVGGTDGTLKWRENNVAVTASPAFTGNPTAPTQAATDNSTKLATTAFVNSFLANSTTTMRFIGRNPTGGVENDTREFWRNKGNCITYINALNQVYEQPIQWGFIVSLVSDDEVNQTFFDQTSGLRYARTGNYSITAMPGWEIVGVAHGTGSHNSTYRGYSLGTAVTSRQWEEIRAGRFRGMYIGDYWTINNVNWRIAAFNYLWKSGDRSCTTNHVIIVPDTNLVSCKMNDTNITTGAYIGSDFYTGNNGNTGRETAIAAVNNAFGHEHILTYRNYFNNAVANGIPSGGAWYDATVELMTERMVYGGKFLEPTSDGTNLPHIFTIEKTQLPLFAMNSSLISNRVSWWLRSVVSNNHFSGVGGYGDAYRFTAGDAIGVRPYFAIYQA